MIAVSTRRLSKRGGAGKANWGRLGDELLEWTTGADEFADEQYLPPLRKIVEVVSDEDEIG